MTREDVYKVIEAVPESARETHKYIYFRASTLKKLKMKSELTKKGFKVYSINDEWIPYDMAIGTNIYYEE